MEYKSYCICGLGIEDIIKGGVSYCFQRDYSAFLFCLVQFDVNAVLL